MNVELLKQVATKLRRMRHKKHFNMHEWAQQTSCGTAACIAGHTLMLQGAKPVKFVPTWGSRGALTSLFLTKNGKEVFASEAATTALGLTAEQADRLFYAENWPHGFAKGRTDPKVAAARIDHFIATKGRE